MTAESAAEATALGQGALPPPKAPRRAARAKVPATAWRNRIVGQGEEPAADLMANPKNWRKHPKAQEQALGGVLDEVGYVQQVIKNVRTGVLIDGHLRVEMASKRRETVPVLYVDLNQEEEDLILATLDPIGAMAATSTERLEALMAELGDRPELDALFADLKAQAGVIEVIGYSDTMESKNEHNNLRKINGSPDGTGYVGLQCGDLMVTIPRSVYDELWAACDDGAAPRRVRVTAILEAGLAADRAS